MPQAKEKDLLGRERSEARLVVIFHRLVFWSRPIGLFWGRWKGIRVDQHGSVHIGVGHGWRGVGRVKRGCVTVQIGDQVETERDFGKLPSWPDVAGSQGRARSEQR